MNIIMVISSNIIDKYKNILYITCRADLRYILVAKAMVMH